MSDKKPKSEISPRALQRFIAIGLIVCAAIIVAAGWLGKNDTVHHGSGTTHSTKSELKVSSRIAPYMPAFGGKPDIDRGPNWLPCGPIVTRSENSSDVLRCV